MQTLPTVLVIDDDNSMRLTLSVILEGEGYQVLQAADGEEGLELLRTSAVDTAVVDMKMPGLSGDEVCAAIKAIRPEATVVMITAHVGEEAKGRAVVSGAHSILYKPLDIEALLGTVAQLVGGAASAPGCDGLALSG